MIENGNCVKIENNSKFKDNTEEKFSTKERQSVNLEESQNSGKEFSSDESEEDSDKKSDNSNELSCDIIETSTIRKKVPDSKFYDKQLLEKKEHEKKYEKIRKKREDEIRNRAKPVINEESKKIMEKKHGFVKPIYQRAKDVEESKKNKISMMKKNIEEKIAQKEEEEIHKSKFLMKNKNLHYNEKEFSDWRDHQIDWEKNKNKKIQNIKEDYQKQHLESVSKFYHPVIDKNSENLAKSKNANTKENNVNVFQKLYNLNEEKHKKLLQKTIDAIPDFKPSINKKIPNYIRNKNIVSHHYSNENITEKVSTNLKSDASKHNFSIEIPSTNYNQMTNVSQSGRTLKSKAMNSSTIETNSNPIIQSLNSDEEEDEDNDDKHYDVVSQYKKALEMNNQAPNIKAKFSENNITNLIENNSTNIIELKATNATENKIDKETINNSPLTKNLNTKKEKVIISKIVPIPKQKVPFSSENNKEKIDFYNKKIEVLISLFKKAPKKK